MAKQMIAMTTAMRKKGGGERIASGKTKSTWKQRKRMPRTGRGDQ